MTRSTRTRTTRTRTTGRRATSARAENTRADQTRAMRVRSSRPALARAGVAALTLAALGATGLTALTSVTAALPSASAAVEPGTPGRDVHVGLDNDDADNGFVQPPTVAAPQHLAEADLLFGRGADDLLIGNRGSDTLIGGPGADLLVGGPDAASGASAGAGSGASARAGARASAGSGAGSGTGNDMVVGEQGDDVAIWSPGDGNDVFAGQENADTFVVAPLLLDGAGAPRLDTVHGRQVPRVVIDHRPDLGCTLVPVSAAQHLGVQFLLRLKVGGTTAATTRLKDVEQVLCPSPAAGTVRVADLTAAHPSFRTVPLGSVGGLVGAIIAPATQGSAS